MTTFAKTETAILVFARAPVPGAAKTRLIPRLSPASAAQLQARMTRRALASACEARIGAVQLWCAPSADDEFFQACAREYPVTLHSQSGSTLGARMQSAQEQAARSHAHVILIGTDCPLLASSHLQAAAADLLNHDAVIIPAEDGGYVLLGLAGAQDEVFRDIAWGSDQVLEETLMRLRGSDRHYRLRQPLWDVDRAEDFDRLANCLPGLVAGLETATPGSDC